MSSKYDVTIVRTFNAPRKLVWDAWTQPTHLAQWWGPTNWTNPKCEVDLRVDGLLHIDMQSPDGTIYPMDGIYKEIEAPERLVISNIVPGENGEMLFEVMQIVTFRELEGKTQLTIEARVIRQLPGAEQYLEGMEAGLQQSLDRLQDLLASAQ